MSTLLTAAPDASGFANELKAHSARLKSGAPRFQFEQNTVEISMVYRDVKLFRADAVDQG